ncbi:MAG: chemotaxis protein CheB [Nitrospira sp.]
MPDDRAHRDSLDPGTLMPTAGMDFPSAPVDGTCNGGHCPLVAIGGSAGSLQALQEFFHALPPSTGFAFVVVLHLSPTSPSSLPELLQHWTKLGVFPARHLQPVRPDHVYVIPPGRYLTCDDGHLHLGAHSSTALRQLTIDVFLRSMAETYGSRSAAIILSGADGDGSAGIQYVKAQGGVTMVQDPATAVYPTMPQCAIATGKVDAVLRAADMPHRLMERLGDPARSRGALPFALDDPPGNSESAELARVLETSLEVIRERTGHDYTGYRRSTLRRRLEHRLELAGADSPDAYLSLLRESPEETKRLARDFLVSVTEFFRDPDHFDALARTIPELFRNKGPHDVIRVWVPGCATGEEVFSLAMLLIECAGRSDSPPAIQIFGSDLEAEPLLVARSGLYPDAIREHLSPERLERFFAKEKAGYRVRRELREPVLFARHDVLKDAPFAHMDLVSCRNLLIYLTSEAQRELLRTLHFSLRPGGLLFLGMADRAEEPFFSPLDGAHKLYRRLSGGATAPCLPSANGLLARCAELRTASPGDTSVSAAAIVLPTESWPLDVNDRGSRDTEELSPADLRASNQELFVINQELRAATEELDINRQELQCINEELTVLTQQLGLSIDELTRANSDLKNFIDATDLGMIFLDRHLKIMRYTSAVTRLFRLIPSDLGRPLADLRHDLQYDRFESDLRAVLTEGVHIEREVSTRDERWFLTRLMPYRTIDLETAGVVVTFLDITDRKHAADQLRESESCLAGQKEAFQAAMSGAPLKASLDVLIRTVVEQSNGTARAAFYLTNRDGTTLHHITGMSDAYARCVDGFKIGTDSLACGLAVQRGEPVITPDVEQDSRWQSWLWLARQFNYRGCWSFPVRTAGGPILGTLAWYFNEPREPSLRMMELAATVTHAAAIIISRHRETEERARVQAALQHSESRYRALVSVTSDIVYKMSADWSEMQSLIGKEFIENTERPRHDWMHAYIPEADQAGLREAIGSAIQSKQAFELEHRVIRLDGTIGWTYSRAVPLFDQMGDIAEWFGTASDITERKQEEATLKTRNVELERFNKVMVTRELRRLELAGESKTQHQATVDPKTSEGEEGEG